MSRRIALGVLSILLIALAVLAVVIGLRLGQVSPTDSSVAIMCEESPTLGDCSCNVNAGSFSIRPVTSISGDPIDSNGNPQDPTCLPNDSQYCGSHYIRDWSEPTGMCVVYVNIGDGFCTPEEASTFGSSDCCGNNVCDPTENSTICPQDCQVAPSCGDGVCNGTETPATCPQDCGTCGNGVCDSGETYLSCPTDCDAPACADGIDNDGDGLVDCNDPGCLDANNQCNPNDDDETNTIVQQPGTCADDIDNDGDGLIDELDPDCHTDGDPNDGDDTYDPTLDEDHNDMANLGECEDGLDNDGDGLIDANDPDCHTDGDPTNANSYVGSLTEDTVPVVATLPKTGIIDDLRFVWMALLMFALAVVVYKRRIGIAQVDVLLGKVMNYFPSSRFEDRVEGSIDSRKDRNKNG